MEWRCVESLQIRSRGRAVGAVEVGSITIAGRREDAAGVALPPPDIGQDVAAITAGFDLPVWRKRLLAGLDDAE